LEGDFEFNGSFAYGSKMSNAPNPLLSIDGLGAIGLPLSEREAKAIIGCSAQAPYGHGQRTVVNKNVRDTKITFQNPDWTRFVEDVTMPAVINGLGASPSQGVPRCELYKLLLYRTGSQ